MITHKERQRTVTVARQRKVRTAARLRAQGEVTCRCAGGRPPLPPPKGRPTRGPGVLPPRWGGLPNTRTLAVGLSPMACPHRLPEQPLRSGGASLRGSGHCADEGRGPLPRPTFTSTLSLARNTLRDKMPRREPPLSYAGPCRLAVACKWAHYYLESTGKRLCCSGVAGNGEERQNKARD